MKTNSSFLKSAKTYFVYCLLFSFLAVSLFGTNIKSAKAADSKTLTITNESHSGKDYPIGLNAYSGTDGSGNPQMALRWNPADGVKAACLPPISTILPGQPGYTQNSSNCAFVVNVYDSSNNHIGPTTYNYPFADTLNDVVGNVKWSTKYKVQIDFRMNNSTQGTLSANVTMPASQVAIGTGSGDCPVTNLTGSWDASNLNAGSGQKANFNWKYDGKPTRLTCPDPSKVTISITGPAGSASQGGDDTSKIWDNATAGAYTFKTLDKNNGNKVIGTNTVTLAASTAANPNGPNGNFDVNSGGSECEQKCPNMLSVIAHAICQMQCAIIDWESGIIGWLISTILYPALGIK